MGTERRLALLALAVAAAGCSNVNRCRSQTILVSIALDATAAQSDTLAVDVAVDGSSNRTLVMHAPGSGAGTIEVRFPSGYPTGKTVAITIVALQGGNSIGTGTTTVVPPSGCATAALAIAGTTVAGEDLSMAESDLSTVDLSMVVRDLATADLSCPSTTENCFNGVDDNCDGLIDCADPQCTGGGTPLAECVPDPSGATAGTLSTTSCPMEYPTARPLFAGMNAGTCAGGTCSCVNGLNGGATCSASLSQQGGTIVSCSQIGTSIFSNKTNLDNCIAFATMSSTTYYSLSTVTLNATCNPPTGGTPIKNPPTWATNDNFCSGTSIGGGCAAGNVCVPKAANHCVLETGDQVACTVPGYSVMNTTHFNSGFDDSGRTCACACVLSGTCGANVGFGNGSCSPLFAVGGGSCQKGLTYDHASIGAPSGVACTPGATSSGSTTTTGFERTVCCTN